MKYNPVKGNYSGQERNVDAIASLKMRLEKYDEASSESPGLTGMSVGEIRDYMEEHRYEY